MSKLLEEQLQTLIDVLDEQGKGPWMDGVKCGFIIAKSISESNQSVDLLADNKVVQKIEWPGFLDDEYLSRLIQIAMEWEESTKERNADRQ
jgi:hypothetical protein